MGDPWRATWATNIRCDDATARIASIYEVSSDSAKASIAIVEFDDQGYLMDPGLYIHILKKLEDIHNEKGALMVVFAHGWKHNADYSDDNLHEFEKMILRINRADRVRCEGQKDCDRNRETIGVFLAWRGLSLKPRGLKELSFWNRKKKAQRVGQDGAIQLLADLDTLNYQKMPS